MSVYKKLQEARIMLQSINLAKTGHNKFAVYDYFELGDFLPSIQTIFNGVGLCGTIKFEQQAELKICDVDKPEDFVIFSCPLAHASLKGCHEVQNLGASITYLRRYLWVIALEIVEHDALDATTGKEEKKEVKPVVRTVKPELKTLTPADLGKYTKDRVGDDGVITAFSPKSAIERGEETAQNFINFLSGRYLVPDDMLAVINAWGRDIQ